MYVVYGNSDSGHCYKVKLALEQLALAYQWVETDSVAGATRTPEFLARNPNGKVPLLELEDGSFLPESNAILWYLAEDTELAPYPAVRAWLERVRRQPRFLPMV